MKHVLYWFFSLFPLIVFSQTLEQDTSLARQLFLEGESLRKEKNYENAVDLYLQSISLYKKHQQDRKALAPQIRLGFVYNTIGKYDESIGLLEEVIASSKRIIGEADTFYLAQAYTEMSSNYSMKGNYERAIDYGLLAISIYDKEENSKVEKIKSYRNLGVAYYYKGEHANALKYYKKVETILVDIEGKTNPKLVSLYGNMAALVYVMGRHEDALDYMLSAMDIMKADSTKTDKGKLAKTYNNIAAVYISLQQPSRAFDYLDKAEVLYKETVGPEHPAIVSAYANKGNILTEMGSYGDAISAYGKAISILEKTKSSPNKLARLYSLIGRVYSNLNQYKKAKKALDKAIQLNISLGGEYYVGVAESYTSLADMYLQKEDFDTFFEWQNKALDVLSKTYGQTHPHIASTYRQLGRASILQNRHELALGYYEKALKANSTDKLASLEEIFEEKKYLSAGELVLILTDITHTYASWFDETDEKIYLEKAYQHALMGQKMVSFLKNELEESSDKQLLLSKSHGINLNAIEIAYLFHQIKDDKHLKEAFHFAELNKSAILMGVLKDDAAKKYSGLPDSVLKKETAMTKQVAMLEKKVLDAQLEQQRDLTITLQGELLETREQLNTYRQDIKDRFPKYAQLKYAESNIEVELIQNQLLEEHTAMLEYFVADSSTYLFVITKNDYQVFRIPFLKGELKGYIKKIRQGLSDYNVILNNPESSTARYAQAAFSLYQKLIEPVLPLLEKVEHLIIVPDGEMGNIPFEALLTKNWEQSKDVNYQELDYLCKQFYISYSYSAAWLLEANKNKHKVVNTKMLAIGASYPDKFVPSDLRSRLLNEMRGNLSPLKSINSEIKALEESFQGHFLYDSMATEQKMKTLAPQYGVLHLAMHGLLDVRNPIASSLVLTENKDSIEDNFLHAYEISQMDLNAALVVLSACETGYGKFEQGEGVLSLARSFMYAGVPSLVVSLWQVNDASTAAIMKHFYENLTQGQAKDEALTNAKMDYLANVKGIAGHPAFWAPFVQIGTAEPIYIKSQGDYWPWLIRGLLLLLGVILWRKIRAR